MEYLYKRINFALFFLIYILLLGGCKKTNTPIPPTVVDPDPPNSGYYFKTKVDGQWVDWYAKNFGVLTAKFQSGILEINANDLQDSLHKQSITLTIYDTSAKRYIFHKLYVGLSISKETAMLSFNKWSGQTRTDFNTWAVGSCSDCSLTLLSSADSVAYGKFKATAINTDLPNSPTVSITEGTFRLKIYKP